MFLTNNATPAQIFHELIARDSDNTETGFETLMHNDDLCPKFQNLVEKILGSYAKFGASVTDIQGFSDHGVDVLVRYTDQDGEKHSFGLQIKSYREIESDLKSSKNDRRLMDTLFSQRTRAQSKHRVEMFYIVLCGDNGKKHRDFVRRVEAEFSSLDDTCVINPSKAWQFYKLDRVEIAAFCARVLCRDDFVLKTMMSALEGMSNEHRRMLVAWVVRHLEGNSSITVDELASYAFTDLPYEIDELELVSDFLNHFEMDYHYENLDGSEFILINPSQDEMQAIYFDIKVRHSLSGQDAIDYICELVTVDV